MRSTITTFIAAALGSLLVVGLGATPATALVFTLDCVESGSNGCTTGSSFGTITILDNALDPDKVDVTIALTGTGRSFRDLLLNFDPAFDNTRWSVTQDGGATAFTVNENGLSLPPLNAFDFDISPDSDVNVPSPETYVIARTSTNLDPAHFDFFASTNPAQALQIYAAVHIQNCGPAAPAQCDPTTTGENSIKVFATEDGGSSTEVPLPGALTLVSLGLGGFAAARQALGRLV